MTRKEKQQQVAEQRAATVTNLLHINPVDALNEIEKNIRVKPGEGELWRSIKLALTQTPGFTAQFKHALWLKKQTEELEVAKKKFEKNKKAAGSVQKAPVKTVEALEATA